MAKPRNWLAVHAHFRKAGPHKPRPRSAPTADEWDLDWRDWCYGDWDDCEDPTCEWCKVPEEEDIAAAPRPVLASPHGDTHE